MIKILITFILSYALCGYLTQKILFSGCKHVEKGGKAVTFFFWPALMIVFGVLAFFCIMADLSYGSDPNDYFREYVKSKRYNRKMISIHHSPFTRKKKRRRF